MDRILMSIPDNLPTKLLVALPDKLVRYINLKNIAVVYNVRLRQTEGVILSRLFYNTLIDLFPSYPRDKPLPEEYSHVYVDREAYPILKFNSWEEATRWVNATTQSYKNPLDESDFNHLSQPWVWLPDYFPAHKEDN